MFYFLFIPLAFLWISALISAVFQYSVAGAIASWYFSRDPSGFSKDVGSPALRSFGRALTKSFGSLAFGALLLAVVQFLNFLVKQSKKYADRNRLTRILLGCVVCCLSCIEGFIQKVDRFTYIHMGNLFLYFSLTYYSYARRKLLDFCKDRFRINLQKLFLSCCSWLLGRLCFVCWQIARNWCHHLCY